MRTNMTCAFFFGHSYSSDYTEKSMMGLLFCWVPCWGWFGSNLSLTFQCRASLFHSSYFEFLCPFLCFGCICWIVKTVCMCLITVPCSDGGWLTQQISLLEVPSGKRQLLFSPKYGGPEGFPRQESHPRMKNQKFKVIFTHEKIAASSSKYYKGWKS